MTLIEIVEEVKRLSHEERQTLFHILMDDIDEEPNPRRLLDIEPISLGGLRPGVKLVSREEFYDDDENGR